MKTHIADFGDNMSFTSCGLRPKTFQPFKIEAVKKALKDGKISERDICEKCIRYFRSELAAENLI
jgi:hypothetical protein